MTRKELDFARIVIKHDDYKVLEDKEERYWLLSLDDTDKEPVELELVARLEFPAGILTAQMKENPGKKGFEKKLVKLYNADFCGNALDSSCAFLWFCYRPQPRKWCLFEEDEGITG